jgi:hypothetical protein
MPPNNTRNCRKSPETRRLQVKYTILYAQTFKMVTMLIFQGFLFSVPFRCLAEDTTLTRNILVSGLILLTDHAPPDTHNSRQSPETRKFQVKWVI